MSACLPAHLKRTLDLITSGCELLCECWELNSGPLKERPVLLTAEQSLKPQTTFFFILFFCKQLLVILLPNSSIFSWGFFRPNGFWH